MPSKRKPARGDRRPGTAAGLVIVVIAAVIGYLALKHVTFAVAAAADGVRGRA